MNVDNWTEAEAGAFLKDLDNAVNTIKQTGQTKPNVVHCTECGERFTGHNAINKFTEQDRIIVNILLLNALFPDWDHGGILFFQDLSHPRSDILIQSPFNRAMIGPGDCCKF